MASATYLCWQYDDGAWWYPTTQVFEAQQTMIFVFFEILVIFKLYYLQSTYADSAEEIFNFNDNGGRILHFRV